MTTKDSHPPNIGVRDILAPINPNQPPHIVIGVTDAQTCLNLTGRLRALREAGFRVTLIASPGDLLKSTAKEQGVSFVALPMHRDIAPLADLVSLLRLWILLRRLRPDVTEFSTPKAGLLGCFASRLAGVPSRVYMLRGLKLETATGLKRALLMAAERAAAACVQRVLCNSASIRNEAMTLGIAPAAKLHLLGSGSSNGVDPERFSPGSTDVRMRLGLTDDAPVLGFVGRLTRDKGIPELLRAFETISTKVPHARLLLVGWFDDSEDALDQSTRNHIVRHPRILRTGFVTDTAPYYRAMDMLILPTLREGFPNAVLEASASGIPVITTLCTGSRDSVLPEVTGLLIPPGYPEAITEAVLKLLRDPARSKRMGEAGRRWVSSQFRDETVLQLAVSFYKGLVEAGAAAQQSIKPDPVKHQPTEHQGTESQLADQASAKKGPARQEPSAQPGKGVKSA